MIPFLLRYIQLVYRNNYEVEGIINERSTDGKQEYIVRWVGKYKPSWQPVNVLEKDCPDLVQVL